MNPLNIIQTQFDVINRAIRGERKLEVQCQCKKVETLRDDDRAFEAQREVELLH